MRSLLLLLLSTLLTGCSIFFGGPEVPKSAKGKHYSVTFSAANWQEARDKRSDFVFENKDDGRIMLSNSFCDEFQDQPLDQLATKTFRSIGEFRQSRGEFTTFNNREAYLLEGDGTVDGVKVGLKLLNTRRNNCYFDFVGITPFTAPARDGAFDQFLRGVEFR
jgi:hypothetical protein